MPRDLHELPKFRDGLSYLYVEHCKIDQESRSIAVHDADGKVPVPCASLAMLMLGPGTSITHAAIRTLARDGCLVVWCGEEGVRLYAQGMGETRSASRLLRQARLWADPGLHMKVVERMYRMRFDEELGENLTLQQLRGMEGVRVRETYAQASRESGVPWEGRSYDRGSWANASPVNRALSAANACLYGLCHAAIVSAGYSTALGFIHTGKQLSFVYDIADLYKTETTLPAAFEVAASGTTSIERNVRGKLRNLFKEKRLLARIVPDIKTSLNVEDAALDADDEMDSSSEPPGGLWDVKESVLQGGVNYGNATLKRQNKDQLRGVKDANDGGAHP